MTNETFLSGLRVLSLAVNVPGPYAAARLVKLGADVTKIEPPEGDFLARAAPSWYRELIAHQSVMTLDLRTPEGREMLMPHLASTDLVILSNRPSALQRMGVDRETLLTRFARLCVVSIVGHGAPDSERPGHDLTYLTEAGVLDGGSLPPSLFADLAAAEEAVSTALALVLQRHRTGAGGWGEVALARSAHALSAPRRHGLTAPGGVLGGGHAGYAFYPARDGMVAVAALEPHFLARFLEALAVASDDPALIAARTRQHSVHALLALGAERDFPIAQVSVAPGRI